MSRSAVPGPPVTREGARDEALAELADPRYDRGLRDVVVDARDTVLDGVGGLLALTGPLGQVLVVLVVAAVLALLAYVVVRLVGSPRRRDAEQSDAVVDDGPRRTAAAHREAADAAAADGRWADAVRERLRAVLRELEERSLVDVLPGRTAARLARDGGSALPGAAGLLRAGAQTFSDVVYGGRPAGPDDDALLRRADEAVRRPRGAGDGPAVQDAPVDWAVPA